MAPRGTKQTAKPDLKNPTEQAPPNVPVEVTPSQVPLPPDTTQTETKPKNKDIPKKAESQDSQSPRSSWYNRTWPRKAAAVTKVAEESITAASDAASSIARAASQSRTKSPTKPARAPSIQLTRSHAGSTRALPANATTTMVHATSDPSLPKADSKQTSDLKADSVQTTGNEPSKTETSARNQQVAGGVGAQEESQVPVSKPAKEKLGKDEASKADATRPETANSKWLGWFASSGTAGKANSSITDASKVEDKSVVKTEVKPDTDGAKIEVPTSSASIPEAKNLSENPATSDPQLAQLSSQKRSWLQMWNSSNGEASAAIPIKGAASPIMKAMANSVGESSSQPGSKAFSLVTSPPPELPGDGNKSAGWIFWSGDRKGGGNTTSDGPRVGELAVSDTPSQKKPKRASIDVEGGREKVKDAIKEPPKPAPVSKGKKQLQAEADSRPQTPAAISKEVSKEITKEEQPTGNQTPTSIKSGKGADLHQASKQLQNSVPTILLPSFKDTFSLQENPSLWQQLARMLNYTKTPEPRHVYKTQDPPRIKSAIAIGVHGYFPAPFIRTVLGQPTGTSIKFADMASKAIRKWTNARGYDCEVKSAALEGEGKIAERVDILWKLLLNWIEEIRKADFILVGCHSQGVPVAIQLVAKLISFGCVNSARIGICAMAGVNLGPFSDYKSRWLSGSASELFDFGDPDSKISKEYLAALETALKFGARVSYIGSIDDQLVSMESSTFSPVSHPHIYRAVFVDGRAHAPNFLTHLVGFALKLRNLGVADHGLIRELSWPLAGSLYTGEGHSRIYEDEAVYDLAIEFALETTSVNNAPLSQRPGPPGSSNPYILPFAMRGLLEEEYVKTELYNEAMDLLKQFDNWKPTSKVLKDVKFRLEGIRSRL